MNVLVIDPSLFTAPYDAALVCALAAAGARPVLATRPDRRENETGLAPAQLRRCFHRASERLPSPFRTAAKAVEHGLDNRRLAHAAQHEAWDVAHFQWLPAPLADAALIAALRRRTGVVVTVHDVQPFNGARRSPLRTLGLHRALARADQLIVHTASGAERLAAQGFNPARINIVPHGPLDAPAALRRTGDGRWTAVMFGKIQPYKGLDLLIEAAARLPAQDRAALRLIVAGQPLIDLNPYRRRIKILGLEGVFDLRPHFHDDAQTAAVLAQADGFVFPYREIDASGVLHLVAGLGRWLIASDIGAFSQMVTPGLGVLTPAGDIDALARALAQAARARPVPQNAPPVTGWDEIARRTLAVYAKAVAR